MLDDAKYVASFEHGDFVYFVMREKAQGVHTATIGRVCKSDPGYSNDQVGESSVRTFFVLLIPCRNIMLPRIEQL